jgi:hypothetical protein
MTLMRYEFLCLLSIHEYAHYAYCYAYFYVYLIIIHGSCMEKGRALIYAKLA